ncbi:MAG: glutamine synthetase family protein [Gammaproteobacteria bacterium]
MSNSKEKLQAFLDDHPELEMFEAILPDINGNQRGKWLPRDQLIHAINGSLKLPRTTLGFDVWGRDVQAWVLDDGDSDGICYADLDTLSSVPWLNRPTGQVLLSMFEVDGSPCLFDCRNIVQRLMARLAQKGYRAVMAAEMEFHLFEQTNNEFGHPEHTQVSFSERPTVGGNTYSIDVMQEQAELMHGVMDAGKQQNLPIDTLIKEAARSQYEVNLFHQDNALRAADQGFLLQRAIRGIAHQLDMRATFMAKPYGDIEGNGMHVHCSLLDEANNNVFDDGTDEGSIILRQAVAGCLATIPDVMILLAPHLNSYRRFQRGSHAPVNPTWGYDNRTAAIRIPASSPKARRLEHRLPGADANPYLVNAAILAGILYGIENELDVAEPIAGDASECRQPDAVILPRYWYQALEKFVASDFIDQYFSPEFKKVFSEAKLQEMDEFDMHVTLKEYDAYL